MNSPVLSDTGEVLSIVHRVDDVTELVHAKAALHVRESEEHLRALVETTPRVREAVQGRARCLQMNPSGWR